MLVPQCPRSRLSTLLSFYFRNSDLDTGRGRGLQVIRLKTCQLCINNEQKGVRELLTAKPRTKQRSDQPKQQVKVRYCLCNGPKHYDIKVSKHHHPEVKISDITHQAATQAEAQIATQLPTLLTPF
jgi:hypothetical protein